MTARRKPPTNPVTLPAREAFILYVREWQERLGMADWRVTVSDKPAARANMAEVVRMDYMARLASIRIGTDFGSATVGDESLEQVALHEMLHVFLKSLIEIAGDENCPADVLASEEHRVIHILVGLLAGKGH
jgi:hypothetical protein